MGLGLAYMLIAAASITLIDGGWSPWLYIVFALCLWNALKVLIFGPISLLLLARARVHEPRAKRDLQRSSADQWARSSRGAPRASVASIDDRQTGGDALSTAQQRPQLRSPAEPDPRSY